MTFARPAIAVNKSLANCVILRVPLNWSSCASFSGLLEIPQIRRRLILLDWHQEAVGAQIVVFLADHDVDAALYAGDPAEGRIGIGVVPERLVDAPGPRQGMIDRGDLVVHQVRIALVEMEPLLEDRLIVEGERQPGRIKGARPLEGPRVSASSTL
jgi:hypothetical protein